tara:strand:- start:1823 stop:2533 length:711 start_codon:yes stop_codon:yes gene_type:complete
MKSYKNYIKQATPINGVFSEERKELGIINNILKWIGIRLSYFFYVLGITPNFLDAVGFVISLSGYLIIFEGLTNNINHYVFFGWLLICFHVLIDYMDGAIARGGGINSNIGTEMDNIGLDLSKFLLLATLGMLTNNNLFILINVFSGIILLLLFINTYKKIPNNPITSVVKNFLSGRRAVLGVRFMLGVIPLSISLLYFLNIEITIVAKTISSFYFFFALLWVFICIPVYNNKRQS